MNNVYQKINEKLLKVTPCALAPWFSILQGTLDKKARSILDVGCGKGSLMEKINRDRHFFTVGVDLFIPYMKEARSRRTHDVHIVCDVRSLPFRKKSFDVVLCSQIIEHLTKDEGLSLIGEAEKIGRQQVIITTPGGFVGRWELDGNPFQAHKSGWTSEELSKMGYNAKGYGLRVVYGEHGLACSLPAPLRPVSFLSSYLATPIVYFFPNLAAQLICVKNVSLAGSQ